MKCRSEIILFTSMLEELVRSGISLEQSLVIISKSDGIPKKIGTAASEICDSLDGGMLFSLALETCASLKFQESYISFIACAECSGNISEILSFLKKADSKKQETLANLKTIVAYPLFILLLIVFCTLVLLVYGQNFFPQLFLSEGSSVLFRQKVIEGCLWGGGFSGVLCLAVLLWGFSVFKIDMKSYSFYALFFLAKSNVPLYQAISCTLQIASKNKALESWFSGILENLRRGISTFSNENNVLDSYSSMLLSLDEHTNSLKNAFKNVARHYEKKMKSHRKLFTRFSEPLLICAAAVYLVILSLHCISGITGGL